MVWEDVEAGIKEVPHKYLEMVPNIRKGLVRRRLQKIDQKEKCNKAKTAEEYK